MDQEVLSNELRFYGLSYVDYVVYAYSKLRRPGQHLRPATLHRMVTVGKAYKLQPVGQQVPAGVRVPDAESVPVV